MALIDMKCPNCGAGMKIDGKTGHAVCPYCGTECLVEQGRLKQTHSRKTAAEEEPLPEPAAAAEAPAEPVRRKAHNWPLLLAVIAVLVFAFMASAEKQARAAAAASAAAGPSYTPGNTMRTSTYRPAAAQSAAAASADSRADRVEAMLEAAGDPTYPRHPDKVSSVAWYAVSDTDENDWHLLAARTCPYRKECTFVLYHAEEYLDADGTSFVSGYHLMSHSEWENHEVWIADSTADDDIISEQNVSFRFLNDKDLPQHFPIEAVAAKDGVRYVAKFRSLEEWMKACETDNIAYSSLLSDYGDLNPYVNGSGRWAFGWQGREVTFSEVRSGSVVLAKTSGTAEKPDPAGWDNPENYASDNAADFDSEQAAVEFWCEYSGQEDAECSG